MTDPELSPGQVHEMLTRERELNALLQMRLRAMTITSQNMSTELAKLMNMHAHGEHDAVKARLTVLVTNAQKAGYRPAQVH